MSSVATPPDGGLDGRLHLRRDAFTLDLTVRVHPGQVLALLGPNGAGKTTALRIVAGLLGLSRGHLRMNGRVLDDPQQRIFLPPELRRVGMVFQEYLLFPHLSAVDNVAFGLRAAGTPRATARRTAAEWLERVGLGGRGAARPANLSGGQAQRVALARALAPGPELLLLDEPLAALDTGTRLRIRAELRAHLAGFATQAAGGTILVSHDPLDAMVLADQLLVVEDGHVVQQGAPAEVARHPRTPYVARLVGLNFYRGRADGGTAWLDGGGTVSLSEPAAGPVVVAFPPTAVALHPARPAGSPRNCWPTVIRGIEQHGQVLRLDLAGTPSVLADVTPAAAAELDLVPGREVWAAVKATEVRAYPD